MGCDFFYDGYLPDICLQEKVIGFVKDFFPTVDLYILPDDGHIYSTEVRLPDIGDEYTPRTETHEEYPFNFFGIIPSCEDEGISDHGQFIFNRNDNGRLVKLRKLPNSFAIMPHYFFQQQSESRPGVKKSDQENRPKISGGIPLSPPNRILTSIPVDTFTLPDVIVHDGGYARFGGGLAFALLLIICKLRWWPDLKMCDDYGYCEIVDALLRKYGMDRQFLDESLGFDACHERFMAEYDRDFTAPSSDGSREGNIQAQARWYLDFWEKIKPYLRERKASES